ncbi:hypothetical protein [Cesiribacter sp. SM1]|uniref:hypothetical protein n=1 Tax=Cesiribacter sp. SM1 TaxID=2861196 RepID=UPI001CD2BBA8|nr:hypothetical protein [Cesiribacter sp. SM1]
MTRKTFSAQRGLWVFLAAFALHIGACTTSELSNTETDKIDRQALVTRHSVKLNSADTLASLSVGNGEFAFTVDVSGLQSFPEYYERGVALGTQSQWGWHVIPTDQHYRVEETYRYDTSCTGNIIAHPVQHNGGREQRAADWLRTNPHRLHLGVVGLQLLKENGEVASVHDLQNINQELNMWTGEIKSRYEVEGVPVTVELFGHQDQDQVAARISSPLIEQNRLKVTLKFPYGSGCHVCPGYDWSQPDAHSTRLTNTGENKAQLERKLDTTLYYTHIQWGRGGQLIEKAKHSFELTPASSEGTFEFSVLFDKEAAKSKMADFSATQSNSQKRWEEFWTEGGVVDFSGSTDPRAHELERRVVLSQYLTRINCAGSLPPQETGLTFNSWYGKFHVEMHWWHGVHFALWDRLPLLEKSLPWYFKSLEKAKAVAKMQGFSGARWQKMTDPYGDESPSSVAPYLVWQQPHILYFTELIYRQHPTAETLEKYKELVFETADFMASFPQYNPQTGYYHLCAPVKPAQELWPSNETLDPPFELAYWHFGLNMAQQWRARLGMQPNEKWQEVLDKLAPLPVVDGVLFPTAAHPDAYTNPEYMRDHPIVLGTFGMLPHYDQIDTAVMKATHHKVLERWDWESTWGWDYPMMAMNAARLHMPEKAVDALFMNLQKNTYLPNGHNYQDKRLRIYLPGNGGLLTAVGMMAAGWDGAPDLHAPGFPKDGSWKVRWEGLHKMP